jgi:hypothetical protein
LFQVCEEAVEGHAGVAGRAAAWGWCGDGLG